jgi:hypothetical protein
VRARGQVRRDVVHAQVDGHTLVPHLGECGDELFPAPRPVRTAVYESNDTHGGDDRR